MNLVLTRWPKIVITKPWFAIALYLVDERVVMSRTKTRFKGLIWRNPQKGKWCNGACWDLSKANKALKRHIADAKFLKEKRYRVFHIHVIQEFPTFPSMPWQSTKPCFNPPASEASREVANLTERKILHTPVYGVKEYVCHGKVP